MKYKIVIVIGLILIIISISIYLGDINEKKEAPPKETPPQEEAPPEKTPPESKPDIDKPKAPQKEITDLGEIMKQQAEKYPNTFFISGPVQQKRIALTFDDGPDEINTRRILETLAQHNVRATFFLIGENVKLFPEIVKQMKNEGHQLGNHSWSHPNFREMNSEKVIKEEIEPTSELIKEITGKYPKLLRPPFGAINDQTIEKLRDENWHIVNWSIDSYDWNIPPEKQHEITNRMIRLHHPGGIILMHNNMKSNGTAAALPDVIKFFKKEGYKFNTLEELLF